MFVVSISTFARWVQFTGWSYSASLGCAIGNYRSIWEDRIASKAFGGQAQLGA